jgi:hypothetical protein
LIGRSKVSASVLTSTGFTFCFLFAASVMGRGQVRSPLPSEVEKVCSIRFDKDARSAQRAWKIAPFRVSKKPRRDCGRMPALKLVLAGVADPVRDHEADENGHMRETEDSTGLDVRWEDLAAYRSLNAKWYLTRWYGIDPVRILPTTDESIQGRMSLFTSCQEPPISITITWEPRRRMSGLAPSSLATPRTKKA